MIPDEPPSFDTGVAHIARVYDYWLGGKDNFAPTASWPSSSWRPTRS